MLPAEKPEQRPVTYRLSHCYMISDCGQCRTTSVQLARIPPLCRLQAVQNASCVFKTCRFAPRTKTRAPNVLEVLDKNEHKSRNTHSSRWIAMVRLRPQNTLERLSPAAIISDVESVPQVCEHIPQFLVEEVFCEHTKQSQQTTQQAVETVLLDAFFTGYTAAEGRPKKGSYQLIETCFSEMAKEKSLYKVLDCSIA